MSLTGFLSYSRVNWQQSPSKSTPWNATNLNIMDAGIKNNNDMISNLRDEVTQLNNNMTLLFLNTIVYKGVSFSFYTLGRLLMIICSKQLTENIPPMKNWTSIGNVTSTNKISTVSNIAIITNNTDIFKLTVMNNEVMIYALKEISSTGNYIEGTFLGCLIK